MAKDQKKLLLLGGIRYLIPVIKTAHKLGLKVITCDYLPNNIAHQYSDEYYNVSIVDKEAVLSLAKELNINGIMSFAVDPGVVTAAYVAEKLGLPTCPYKSVKILQNKVLFRKFLKENNFNVPTAQGFSKENISDKELSKFNFPVIVKPVDSAGSKGVTKVNKIDDINSAIRIAISNSICGNYIIENFIEKKGFSSDTDCFSVNGKMKFYSFSNQRFDINASNPYTPSAYSWPSSMNDKNQNILKKELQRLVSLLNLGTSIYNVETRVGIDEKPYIMEVSPRGGGNRLAEMLGYATGIDLIKNSIKAAIGDDNLDVFQKEYDGCWAEAILHSNNNGLFKEIKIDPKVKAKNLIELDLWVNKGDKISTFNGASDAIGTVILKFKTQDQLEKTMSCQNSWLTIKVGK